MLYQTVLSSVLALNACHEDDEECVKAALEEPSSLDNVDASLNTTEHGFAFDVGYELPGLPTISLHLEGDDQGTGRGTVRCGEGMITEVHYRHGMMVSQDVDISGLRPEDGVELSASVLQVWENAAVADALDAAGLRAKKCSLAGALAGASAAALAGSACVGLGGGGICSTVAKWAYSKASGYITDKCNGAQNNK